MNIQVNTGRQGGFTLVELMVSIAIVLLLIMGVNFIFGTTSRTIGAGQAGSDISRDHKAARTVFVEDWKGFAPDGPVMIIHSRTVVAYMNRADEDADLDNNPATVDLDADGNYNSYGEDVAATPWVYNNRNHRVDTLSFFSRGYFERQTSSDGVNLVTPFTSNEAWIWYGHLRIVDNQPTPATFPPGFGTSTSNPNNYYATDWALGRRVILLRDVLPPSYQGGFPDDVGLAPLQFGSPSLPAGWPIQTSQYDLAQTSIERFRQDVLDAIAADATPNLSMWWQSLVYDGSGAVDDASVYRFHCDPFVGSDPTPDRVARATPFFLGACTQFIVEFAGDFVTQDNDPASATYGNVIAAQPDGILDFMVDRQGGTPARWLRKTRWYGMYRDSSGDGAIDEQLDVVPVAFLINPSDPANFTTRRPFEKEVPVLNPPAPPNTLRNYTCVFGPNDPRPQMLRIIVRIDDPRGRLAGGQEYEYVLGAP